MLEQVRQSIRDALQTMPIQSQTIDPSVVWRQIKDNPDKTLGYVALRTGYSGDELLKEVTVYQQAMKARYG